MCREPSIAQHATHEARIQAKRKSNTNPELALIPILSEVIHAQRLLLCCNAQVLEALLSRIAVRIELLKGVERRGGQDTGKFNVSKYIASSRN
jgi:hypothetical protein